MPESVDIHLDWLRYTFHYTGENAIESDLRTARPHGHIFDWTGETFPAGEGYTDGRGMGAGKVFWHKSRPEQGIGVQLTGTDLDAVRQDGIPDIDLLTYAKSIGATISTLHACINVKNAGARVVDVLTARDDGSLKTRARQIGKYSSDKKRKKQWFSSDTVYVGSPSSNIQIRIYDKAAERGIEADWKRIEIIWHGKYAQAASDAMLLHGIDPVTRGGILKQMDFSAGWWEYAMHGDTSQPAPVPRKETARYTWLKNVVYNAWLKEIEEQKRLGLGLALELLEDLHVEAKKQGV